MPEVTIIVPVYNEERHLGAAIESLLAQDFRDFELLIADNASTDGTVQIANSYAAKDGRIRVSASPQNRGAVWNFNRLVPSANGRFLMWAGGHDLWDRRFLSKCLQPLRRDERVVLAYPRTRWIGPDGATLREVSDGLGMDVLGTVSRFNTVLWRTVKCTPVYGLIRTAALRRTRLFRQVFGADLVLLAELACYGAFVELPEALFMRRENREPEDPSVQVSRIYEMMVPRSARRGPRLPYWEMALAFPGMVLGTELDAPTKVALLASLAVCVPTRFGSRMLAELRAALRP